MPPSMKTRSQPFLETLVTGTAARPSPVREQEWKDALDALKQEDHYILVMVRQAFGVGSAASGGKQLRDLLLSIRRHRCRPRSDCDSGIHVEDWALRRCP